VRAEGEVVRFPTEDVGARARFDSFFAEEHERLFKALYFVTGNRHDAEELMQDAFLKLWERWDTADSIGDLTGYLFRVALNGFRSRRRRAAVAIRKVTPIPEDRDAFLDAEMRADVRQLLLEVTPRDATKLAYITRSKDVGFCGACVDVAQMAVVNADGTDSHFVPIPNESHFTVDPNSPVSNLPAWSPDGSRIAIVVTKKGNTDIYVMDADGSHQRRLTTSLAQDEFPSWSPDGSTIVYDSSGSTPLDNSGLSPTQEIWSVPAAGGTPVRLTNNHASDQAPSYSPDGTKIAFFEPDGITEMDADGRNVRPVAGASGGWTPRWSPDGSRIAFLVFSGGQGYVPDPAMGTDTYALPLGTVKIVSVATGEVTSLPVQVTTSYNAVSWMPSSDALLVNRYQQP
jgi:hypothetical protein